MATARNRSHKHFQWDSVKIKRAQRGLHAKTETETIVRFPGTVQKCKWKSQRGSVAFRARLGFGDCRTPEEPLGS
jgi:hypothetical protein